MVSRDRRSSADLLNSNARLRDERLRFHLVAARVQVAAWQEEWPERKETSRAIREAVRQTRVKTKNTREESRRLIDEARRLMKRDR